MLIQFDKKNIIDAQQQQQLFEINYLDARRGVLDLPEKSRPS